MGAREGGLRVLNQMIDDHRKELKKRETLTYATRKMIPIPPTQNSVHSQPQKKSPSHMRKEAPSQLRKESPSQPTRKILPPPLHALLVKPTQIDEEI